ncbi:hypothetical protein [Ruminococcus sp.]|nr:hypothetical protein [Ruminococcus sp.]
MSIVKAQNFAGGREGDHSKEENYHRSKVVQIQPHKKPDLI